MNDDKDQRLALTKFQTKKQKQAIERFKYTLGLHWLKLGYKVHFKIEREEKQSLLVVQVTDPRVGLWATAATPMDMVEHKDLWEPAVLATSQTIWKRMGQGLRGMRRDQKCWLRLKARRDRRRKEEQSGKKESHQEEHGPGIINLDDAKARARAREAGLYVP